MRRTLILVVATLIAALVAAPAALADKPIKVTEEFTTLATLAECGEFDLMLEEDFTLTSKEFFKQGELDRIQFHAEIDGLLYNSEDPDKSLQAVSHYNFVTYAEDLFVVWTQHGLFWRVDLPQGGHVVVDAGSFTIELVDDLPVILWQAGPQPFEFVEGDFEAVCDALS